MLEPVNALDEELINPRSGNFFLDDHAAFKGHERFYTSLNYMWDSAVEGIVEPIESVMMEAYEMVEFFYVMKVLSDLE